MKLASPLIGLLLISQIGWAQDQIEISLVTGDAREAEAKEQLQRILKSYDLSKWIFTRSVAIDRRAIPHSHPRLTLNTRHLDNDNLQLSTFVHEEIHWHLVAKAEQTDQAVKELENAYPAAPTEPPDGAGGRDSTYLHLIVNYLEYEAMKTLIGPTKADEVFNFWTTDHYRWIYKTVLADSSKIRAIVEKYRLQI